MKKNIIKSLVALTLGALLLAGCRKDNDALIGKWSNTSQSYEITIGGQEYLPKGCIYMEFTESKVLISDSRTDCLAEWHNYTFSKESGKQLICGGKAHQRRAGVGSETSRKRQGLPLHHETGLDINIVI